MKRLTSEFRYSEHAPQWMICLAICSAGRKSAHHLHAAHDVCPSPSASARRSCWPVNRSAAIRRLPGVGPPARADRQQHRAITERIRCHSARPVHANREPITYSDGVPARRRPRFSAFQAMTNQCAGNWCHRPDRIVVVPLRAIGIATKLRGARQSLSFSSEVCRLSRFSCTSQIAVLFLAAVEPHLCGNSGIGNVIAKSAFADPL